MGDACNRIVRRVTLLLMVLAASSVSRAQSYDVVGGVVDSTGGSLGGATVVLLQAADSVLAKFAVTRPDGSFVLRRVAPGGYVLQITFVGFEPFSKDLEVVDDVVDLGALALRESVAELSELVVRADRVPIVLKKDTIEYNAAAFPMRPGANVEDLLKRLPGLEVERDGSIRAQGENVEQVLVDGKEFFGNDPTIATRNLPAEAVDRVQVFDKLSDMAEFTGIDDGEESRTINLALREDHKSGLFGNVEGGYGSERRYDGRASVNRFSPISQMSVIANVNNVNRQGFSARDYMRFMGGMQGLMIGGAGSGSRLPIGTSLSDGFSTTSAGGLNANVDLGARTSLRTSYFLNHIRNELDRSTRREQLFGASESSLIRQAGLQESTNLSHRLDMVAEHEFSKRQDLRLRANLQMSDSMLDNLIGSETYAGQIEPENTSETSYRSNGEDLGGDASLVYRHRLNERGSTVVAEAASRLNDSAVDGDLEATNRFLHSGTDPIEEAIVQRQELSGTTRSGRGRIAYSEPLNRHNMVELHAERRIVGERQTKDFLDIGPDGPASNPRLSSAFERTYTYNSAGANLRRVRGRTRAQVGVDVQSAQLDAEVLSNGAMVDRRFVDLLPTASIGYEFDGNMNLELRYAASTREPSMRELQPFVDNSDPLYVYAGNPELTPEYVQNLQSFFHFFDQFTFTNLFAFARLTYTTNAIVRSRTVDEQFRQTVTSINGDGEWMLSGSISFGTSIRPLRSRVRASNRILVTRGNELINGENNATKSLRNSVDVRLENRNKETVDASAGMRYTFNSNRYSLDSALDRTYLNRSYFADIAVYLSDHWRVSGTFDYRLFSREVFGNGRNVPLWGAEVARTVLDGAAEIQLAAFDILDRNIGVNFANEVGYVQQEQVKSLGRYVLLKFVYRLSGTRDEGGIRVEMMD